MLKIAQGLYNEVVAHCQSVYPKEGCGLLAGKDGVVSQVYVMTNTEDSPIGYALDPIEQLRVEKLMRQRGQQWIGVFHSHTKTGASPSPVDIGLAISPDLSYVLVSLQDRAKPDFKSYRIDGKTVTPEPHTIT